jgi:hypothetical protein
LRISDQQMGVLQSDMDRRYADELITYMRQTTPEIVVADSDEVLRSRIMAVLPAARGYGIHGDNATAQIAMLAAAIGPAFLDQDDVKRFLEATEPPADAKVEMLCEILSDSL